MAPRWIPLVALLAGAILLPACATTGASRVRTPEPETRTLQSIEVDGSVRVRSNHYRR